MNKNSIIEAGLIKDARGDGQPSAATPGAQNFEHRAQLRRLIFATVILILCFSKPLYDLARYVLKSELYSHVLLIPFVSLYLVWIRRGISIPASAPARGWVVIPLALGMGSLALYWIALNADWTLRRNDTLALTTLSFISFFVGACVIFLGRRTLRSVAFPLGFLLFMVPFPTFVENGIETFFQHTSAAAAHAMITMAGTPLFRDGLSFQLPGVRLLVASECSGIRSSLVLLITSLIAGKLFLRSPWKRAILALAVIPLGIIRNGFRIFTIAELCVHVSPNMIDSAIHHHGGPVFFLLSLIPFFLLLILLRKMDSPAKPLSQTKVIEAKI